MRRLRARFSLLLILITTAQAGAQTSLQQKIATAFNKLQADSQCRYASVSLTVLDAKTGEQVFAANPKMGLAPGSTLKCITSITALNALGKDYQFSTVIGYRGSITADGTLNGDIIIHGNGDPTLGSWRWETTKERIIFNQIIAALKTAGIKRVNGSIIGDDAAYGTQAIPDGWINQDLGTYYGAGISALCWRENQFAVKLRTGAVASPIGIAGTQPNMPFLSFKSELTNGAAGTGDQGYPYLPATNSNVMYLRGTYAIDKTQKTIATASPDPAYDFAWHLTDTLKTLGIAVSSTPESATTLRNKNLPMPQAGLSLLTLKSPALSSILYWQNHISINLFAEQVLIASIPQNTLKPNTTNAVKALQSFWTTKGIDANTLNIFDGSGLSPGNRVTTLTMARILQSVVKESWYSAFYESLPVYNDMHMKSGSINSCQAYAGYQTHAGRQLCFSIIVNNYNGGGRAIKEKMFKVLDELK
ncbi:D-alanyl-D-alanine carboxypeptidase/D-alanyl-D-alanine endopeptidase [Mucilaginibacter antarcticus]|uniref:D-alanyl-D-alanine carboxypeptidase/D-alanyl-D-alanine-endopeptidase n=1 Tax=Mucilaginibacter antarcticus TaxID=1855725 RepID=A0ABW5XPC3_9SPHI